MAKVKTHLVDFLIAIDNTSEATLREIMGDGYIDTPGTYRSEGAAYEDIFDFMQSNMGGASFEELISWHDSNPDLVNLIIGEHSTNSRKWVAVVTGPREYLREEVKIETFSITQDEIDECREGDESDDAVIDYILEEYHNEWEQRWCRAQVFTLGQYKIINPDFQWSE